MAKLRCETVTGGLRASEVLAEVVDFKGRRHFLRVEHDFLYENEFLPVGIVHEDSQQGLVLIELPQEAETGANRLWVRKEQLQNLVGVGA